MSKTIYLYWQQFRQEDMIFTLEVFAHTRKRGWQLKHIEELKERVVQLTVPTHTPLEFTIRSISLKTGCNLHEKLAIQAIDEVPLPYGSKKTGIILSEDKEPRVHQIRLQYRAPGPFVSPETVPVKDSDGDTAMQVKDAPEGTLRALLEGIDQNITAHSQTLKPTKHPSISEGQANNIHFWSYDNGIVPCSAVNFFCHEMPIHDDILERLYDVALALTAFSRARTHSKRDQNIVLLCSLITVWSRALGYRPDVKVTSKKRVAVDVFEDARRNAGGDCDDYGRLTAQVFMALDTSKSTKLQSLCELAHEMNIYVALISTTGGSHVDAPHVTVLLDDVKHGRTYLAETTNTTCPNWFMETDFVDRDTEAHIEEILESTRQAAQIDIPASPKIFDDFFSGLLLDLIDVRRRKHYICIDKETRKLGVPFVDVIHDGMRQTVAIVDTQEYVMDEATFDISHPSLPPPTFHSPPNHLIYDLLFRAKTKELPSAHTKAAKEIADSGAFCFLIPLFDILHNAPDWFDENAHQLHVIGGPDGIPFLLFVPDMIPHVVREYATSHKIPQLMEVVKSGSFSQGVAHAIHNGIEGTTLEVLHAFDQNLSPRMREHVLVHTGSRLVHELAKEGTSKLKDHMKMRYTEQFKKVMGPLLKRHEEMIPGALEAIKEISQHLKHKHSDTEESGGDDDEEEHKHSSKKKAAKKGKGKPKKRRGSTSGSDNESGSDVKEDKEEENSEEEEEENASGSEKEDKKKFKKPRSPPRKSHKKEESSTESQSELSETQSASEQSDSSTASQASRPRNHRKGKKGHK